MSRTYQRNWSAIKVSYCMSFVLLAAASCGSKEKFEIKVEELNFCEEVSEMICRNMFQCCTGANIESILGVRISTDETECRRDVELICEKTNHKLIHAVEKGKAKILTERATSCLNALLVKEEACFVDEPQPAWYSACKDFLYEGLVPVEEPCQTSIECQPNHFCGVDMKCKAFPQEGEPCPETICADGLFCSYQIREKKLLCLPLRVDGEKCETTGQCAEDHYCETKLNLTEPLPELNGTCHYKKELGELCDDDHSCFSDYCIPGICSNNITKACYKDSQCGGTCEKSENSCESDKDCGGKCAKSGYSCSSDYQCDDYTNDECVFEKCILHKCEGNPICGEVFRLTDYCAGPIQMLLGQKDHTGDTTIPTTTTCQQACQKAAGCGTSMYDAICQGTCSSDKSCLASCILSASCSSILSPSSSSSFYSCFTSCQGP